MTDTTLNTKSKLQGEHDEFAREFNGGLHLPGASPGPATRAAEAGVRAENASLPHEMQDDSQPGDDDDTDEDGKPKKAAA